MRSVEDRPAASAVRPPRCRDARVRDQPARHAHAMAELHRPGRLRRHRLEHRGWLLVRPGPTRTARQPATATTRSRPTSPAATSTSATRRPGASGARRGSRSGETSTRTSAGTAPATRASGARSTGSRARCSTSSRPPAPMGPARASCGCCASGTRAPALRRLRTFSYAEFGYVDSLHRPAQPGLVAAHRLQQARGQRDPRRDAVPPDDHVLRRERAPVRLDRRPRGLRGSVPRPRRTRSWSRPASRRTPAPRVATPSARSATTSRSARARNASSSSSWA